MLVYHHDAAAIHLGGVVVMPLWCKTPRDQSHSRTNTSRSFRFHTAHRKRMRRRTWTRFASTSVRTSHWASESLNRLSENRPKVPVACRKCEALIRNEVESTYRPAEMPATRPHASTEHNMQTVQRKRQTKCRALSRKAERKPHWGHRM